MIFSCIIPASKRDAESQNLKDLIASIRAQDFPQDQIETIVVTEGDSEQAKAIGIRQAKGEICAMFCADNYLLVKDVFSRVFAYFKENSPVGVYSKHYALVQTDKSLNRYFSLIGTNDPVPFYLGKADRKPAFEFDCDESFTALVFDGPIPSLGDNGFFFKKSILEKSNLDHFYPMDICQDLKDQGFNWYIRTSGSYLWHRTSDNLISFLIKRYKYARDLYCDRTDRRWLMVGTREDKWRLFTFVFFTLTVVEPLYVSLRGFFKVRDYAWFWHWPVCFGFLITYTILALRNLCKHGSLFQRRGSASLSQPLAAVQN